MEEDVAIKCSLCDKEFHRKSPVDGDAICPDCTSILEEPEDLTGESSEKFDSGGIRAYPICITVPAINIRKGPGTDTPVVRTFVKEKSVQMIVEEADGLGSSKWGKLESGIGWIALDYTHRV
jgi:DNA-directed RNA polymerase subunit RPC12/RpoP